MQFNILNNYQKGYICHPILGVRMGIQGHMKRSQMGHIKDPLVGQSEDPLEGQSKDPLVGRIKDPIYNNCTPYYVIFAMYYSMYVYIVIVTLTIVSCIMLRSL